MWSLIGIILSQSEANSENKTYIKSEIISEFLFYEFCLFDSLIFDFPNCIIQTIQKSNVFDKILRGTLCRWSFKTSFSNCIFNFHCILKACLYPITNRTEAHWLWIHTICLKYFDLFFKIILKITPKFDIHKKKYGKYAFIVRIKLWMRSFFHSRDKFAFSPNLILLLSPLSVIDQTFNKWPPLPQLLLQALNL